MSSGVNDPVSMVARPGAGYASQGLLVDGKVISTGCLVERRGRSLLGA